MRKPVALLVLCVSISGCGDDPNEPTTASGSVSFAYTGAGSSASTSFAASGSIPSHIGTNMNANDLGSSAWAAGSVSPTSNYVTIGGVIPRSSTAWDVASISVARKTTGSSNIDPNCDIEETDCTNVFVFFNYNPGAESFSYLCSLTTGTVTISAISSSNITGSFTGSGECITPLLGVSTFTVANGSFNVGITTQLLDDGSP